MGELMTNLPEQAKFMALPAGFKVLQNGNDAKIEFDENMVGK